MVTDISKGENLLVFSPVGQWKKNFTRKTLQVDRKVNFEPCYRLQNTRSMQSKHRDLTDVSGQQLNSP